MNMLTDVIVMCASMISRSDPATSYGVASATVDQLGELKRGTCSKIILSCIL